VSAFHGEGRHETDGDDLRTGLPQMLWRPSDRRRVEVGRVVFAVRC
jgi:hypothetical protein